ncbi:hypothetical protein GVAV_000795 [Gurleya vavrai]
MENQENDMTIIYKKLIKNEKDDLDNKLYVYIITKIHNPDFKEHLNSLHEDLSDYKNIDEEILEQHYNQQIEEFTKILEQNLEDSTKKFTEIFKRDITRKITCLRYKLLYNELTEEILSNTNFFFEHKSNDDLIFLDNLIYQKIVIKAFKSKKMLLILLDTFKNKNKISLINDVIQICQKGKENVATSFFYHNEINRLYIETLLKLTKTVFCQNLDKIIVKLCSKDKSECFNLIINDDFLEQITLFHEMYVKILKKFEENVPNDILDVKIIDKWLFYKNFYKSSIFEKFLFDFQRILEHIQNYDLNLSSYNLNLEEIEAIVISGCLYNANDLLASLIENLNNTKFFLTNSNFDKESTNNQEIFDDNNINENDGIFKNDVNEIFLEIMNKKLYNFSDKGVIDHVQAEFEFAFCFLIKNQLNTDESICILSTEFFEDKSVRFVAKRNLKTVLTTQELSKYLQYYYKKNFIFYKENFVSFFNKSNERFYEQIDIYSDIIAKIDNEKLKDKKQKKYQNLVNYDIDTIQNTIIINQKIFLEYKNFIENLQITTNKITFTLFCIDDIKQTEILNYIEILQNIFELLN